MNSLERFQAAMRRAPVDRLPWNANMVPELAQKLIQHFDLADSEALLYNFLGIDRRRLLPRYTGPEPARYVQRIVRTGGLSGSRGLPPGECAGRGGSGTLCLAKRGRL